MSIKEKGHPPQTALNKTSDNQNTRNDTDLSSKKAERIAKRRADMPQIYRGQYDRAMQGKSLRAAINAFCLECVQWQRVEVRKCPSTPCPLYLYRPYKTDPTVSGSNLPSEGPDSAPESTNRRETDNDSK